MAEKGVNAVSKLGQGAGHAPGGQARTGAVDEVTEDLETSGPGGELRSGRRRLIQRSTIHRLPSRSRSQKAMRDAKSEGITARRVSEEPAPILLGHIEELDGAQKGAPTGA
jgi:hypothetical protein